MPRTTALKTRPRRRRLHPDILRIIEAAGEFAAAAIIIGAAFWLPWLFYILTGEYLDFGGPR